MLDASGLITSQGNKPRRGLMRFTEDGQPLQTDHEIFTVQDFELAKAERESADKAYRDVIHHEKSLNS